MIRRRLLVLASTAALVAGMTLTLGAGLAVASTDLHQQTPIVGSEFKQECSDAETASLGADQTLWHFVLVQTTARNSGTLTTEWNTDGTGTTIDPTAEQTTVSIKTSGGVVHWDVIVPSIWILMGATTDGDGALLNLSHVCVGGGGGGGNTSGLSTVVHLGATDSGTAVVVDNANPAALGSTVHDAATITLTGGGSLSSGQVLFSFWNNNTCDGTAADMSADGAFPVSGPTDITVDPGLVESALGAGAYSFSAYFASDDSNYPDAQGDCEPLTINKGTLGIATDIHNALHQVITSATVGAVVHDTAPLSGATSGFAPDLSKVTFHFYTTIDCSGSYSTPATSTEDNGTLARSADSSALAFGSYSYNATFIGDSNYSATDASACEPLSVFRAALTPGYWKNHLANSAKSGPYTDPLCSSTTVKNDGGSCSSSGPWTKQYLAVTLSTNYTVNSIVDAANVFAKMNCSSTKPNDAIGCLAGHLLAAKLNVANGANTCISSVIAKAQTFLSSGVADGVTGINYIGPTGTYSLTTAQRAEAVALKNAFDKYNNGGGC